MEINYFVGPVSFIIGSMLGSYIMTRIKANKDRERDLLGWAMKAAIKDYEFSDYNGKKITISSHLYFHFHWLKLLDKNKADKSTLEMLTKKALDLNEKSNDLFESYGIKQVKK